MKVDGDMAAVRERPDDWAGARQRPWQRALIGFAALKPATWFFRQFVHRADRALLRLTRGARSASAPFTGLPTANVTTIGAKSGLPRTVPLVVVADGENLAVAASNFGRANYPAWYFNLRANPEATVAMSGGSGTYLAREAGEEERARLWPRFVALYPGYAAYAQRAAHRDIPILVLSPKERR